MKKGSKHSPESIRKSIESHKGQIAWNKGLTKDDPRVKKYADKLSKRKFTSEWIKKMSIAKHGKILSDTHRQNISKGLTGRKRSSAERKAISQGQIGKKFSEDTKEKMKLVKLGKKQSEEHRLSKIRGWTSEKRLLASERRSKQKLPLKDTKPEMIVESILSKYRIPYAKQYKIRLEIKEVKIHQADFFIEPKKIIEVFGTYHHADPEKYSDDKILRVKGHTSALNIREMDDKIIEGMEKKGFKVLIIWQKELKNDYDKTEKRILNFIM